MIFLNREQYEKALTEMSLAEIENYQDTDFLELRESSSRRNYEKCTKMIVEAPLKPVEIKDFSLNRARTKEILSWMLPILFEDIDVDDILSKIKIDRTFLRGEMDIMVETNKDDKLQSFYLSSFKNLTTIPILVNAYANHVFYKDIYTKETFGNYNYKKIPGAVLEKIAAVEAARETFLEHVEALDYSRLQHLKQAITILDTMDANSYRIPKDSFERKIYEYQKYDTFMPVIADIYGESLFRAYLMDEQTFLILFRRLYHREIKIEDLLAYYDISLKNPKTIKIYEKRIEHAKKTNLVFF